MIIRLLTDILYIFGVGGESLKTQIPYSRTRFEKTATRKCFVFVFLFFSKRRRCRASPADTGSWNSRVAGQRS